MLGLCGYDRAGGAARARKSVNIFFHAQYFPRVAWSPFFIPFVDDKYLDDS